MKKVKEKCKNCEGIGTPTPECPGDYIIGMSKCHICKGTGEVEANLDFQVGDKVCLPYDHLFVADGHIVALDGYNAKVKLEYLHNYAEITRAMDEFRTKCLEFHVETYRWVGLTKLTFISGSEEGE